MFCSVKICMLSRITLMTLALFFISLLMNFVVTVSIGDIRSAWCYGTKLV